MRGGGNLGEFRVRGEFIQVMSRLGEEKQVAGGDGKKPKRLWPQGHRSSDWEDLVGGIFFFVVGKCLNL